MNDHVGHEHIDPGTIDDFLLLVAGMVAEKMKIPDGEPDGVYVVVEFDVPEGRLALNYTNKPRELKTVVLWHYEKCGEPWGKPWRKV